MVWQVILEGLGLGLLLVLVCAFGIRKGPVKMVHLYSPEVQQRCVELGLMTREAITRSSLQFKAVCLPGYIAYVLVMVYAVNGTLGFAAGFWQLFVILSIMNIIDRFAAGTRYAHGVKKQDGRIVFIAECFKLHRVSSLSGRTGS